MPKFVECPECGQTLTARRDEAHRGAPCEAACAAADARADGLEHLNEADEWMRELLALGVRVERRRTGLPALHGFGRRTPHALEEWWTEAWVARIASWEGAEHHHRERAIARLMGSPAMLADARPQIEACEPVVFTEHANVQLLTPGGAVVMLTESPGLCWLITFDEDGQIAGSVLDARMAKYEGEPDWPPLHVMLVVQPVIEQFARCSAMIHWLAGER